MTGWASLLGALGLVAIVFGLVSFVLLLFGAPSDPAWIYGNFAVGVTLLGSAVNLWYADHLLQRRTFVYQALHELSDADERDIPLSRALLQADALIEQIVEREMEIEQRHTLRTKAYAP